MTAVVIDSNVLIASHNEDDERYDSSDAIVSGIDHGTLPEAHVTEYVVAEVLNLLHGRYSHELALDTYERLDHGTGFRLVHTTEDDFARAVELFYRFDGIAFVDAVLAAYMNRTDIEYLYSLDDDFDALESVSRLQTATNPFAP
ncbi:type II toxin-antitoxin system VapC family toxin [Halorussus halophilus]|uniref:type II toxin-antitoxin system VapC family toxin n=1 Tax=Halorussus halophilus TaxID=2650975 RepID=UPI00130101EB|nr:PIN domain-containing protein [Halorussus halophilus]